MKVIDYYMAVGSPWTYMGSRRFVEIAAAAGATINIKPINAGELFSSTGGLPVPKRHPNRQSYRMIELARWRSQLGLEFNLQPTHFGKPDKFGAAMVAAAKLDGLDAIMLAHHVMAALWERDLEITAADVLVSLADEVGLDGAGLLARCADQDVTTLIANNTSDAIAGGVFGVPWYVVDDMPFWGQDRLSFVAEALDASADGGEPAA